MTAPLFHPLIAKQDGSMHLAKTAASHDDMHEHTRKLEDHGCHERWEDEGGAIVASGAQFAQEATQKVAAAKSALESPAAENKVTWLQYASRKAPQTRALPDWKLVLASVRKGSMLSNLSTRRRSVA